MWISGKEYDDLIRCKEINDELKKEINRLAALISNQVEDCKVGPWCNDCKHVGKDKSEVAIFDSLGLYYGSHKDGEVTYCKKHLHSICPEFEMRKD